MISKGRKSEDIVDFKSIQEKTSESALLCHYLGVDKIPSLIKSPLRQENNPSFGLFSKDGNHIYYKDFATGESGNVYNLLSKLWDLPIRETYRRIAKDFIVPSVTNTTKHTKVYKASDTILKCRKREWEQHDIDYWNSYGVPVKWLDYAEVYPISHKIYIKDNKEMVFGVDKYAYAFVEHKEGNTTLKIYQPFNQYGYKWISKHDGSVISLWTKIPQKGEKLVICSSVKDALCLWANTLVPAIALQGEGYIMSDTAINQLKQRYENIYILFDNDDPGIYNGKNLSKLTGFTYLELPQFSGGKDVSDLYKSDKTYFKRIINKLLNNETKEKH